MRESDPTSTVNPVTEFLNWYGIAEKPAGQVGDVSNAFGATMPVMPWIGAVYTFWKSWNTNNKNRINLCDLLDATLQHIGVPADERESTKRFIQVPSTARDDLLRANTKAEFKTAILNIAGNQANLNSPDGQKLLEVFTTMRFHQGGQGAMNILRNEVNVIPDIITTLQAQLNAIPDGIRANLQAELRSGFQQQLTAIAATLNANRSTAALPEPLEKWEPTSAPSRILKANTGITDLIGRDQQMQDLVDWCDISIHNEHTLSKLIHAPGGMGKTRLGFELCIHMNGDAWHTGFVNTTKSSAEQVTALLESNADLLIVLDYPEGHADVLKIWVESIASQRTARAAKGLTTRLLMLARTDDWISTPRGNLSVGADFLDPDSSLFSVQKLEALETTSTRNEFETRKALYDHVKARYATALEQTSWKRTNSKPAPMPDFAQAVFARPLMLNVQAVLDCTNAITTTGIVTIENLLGKLMEFESKHWTEILSIPTQDAEAFKEKFERTVARVVLGITPHDEDETLTLLRHEPDWHTTDPTILRKYAKALKRTYPGSPHLETLQPDLLGEFVALRALEGPQGDALIQTLFCNPGTTVNLEHTLTVLIRLAGWMTERSKKIRERIEASVRHNPDKAEHIFDVLTKMNSSTYNPLTVTAGQQFLNPKAFVTVLATDTATLNRVGQLNNLAVRLGDVGDQENAFEAAQTVTDIYRRLARDNPQAFNPDLARSLNNLGARFNALGRREEALIATQEAVDLRRDLARDNPQAFDSDLAASLNNLGGNLNYLGRREEALIASQEAVDLYRILARGNPQVFNPDLAASLNNLGCDLSDLGRREEALIATQEAVDLRRDLARGNPQAFNPDHAMSLNNLGARFNALGRREEALIATQEAVKVYRDLARDNPHAFNPDLAMSLNNLGNRFNALGRHEEALNASQEAVDLRRVLARGNPQAFNPDLAISLNNLSGNLSALGRHEEALNASQEAVNLRRVLARGNPQAFNPNLAASLNNLGNMFSNLGRREEALKATQDAVGLRRELARGNPQAFNPDLASSLNNLGAMFSDLGRREEALTATQEAVDRYRDLAQDNPQAFNSDLAMSLNNLGDQFKKNNQRQEAHPHYVGALRALAPYFLALPAAHGQRMKYMIQDYAKSCQALNFEPDMELLTPILLKFQELEA